MDYHAVSQFAQVWGLVVLFALFICAVVYALWPNNRARFEHASRMPLEELEENEHVEP